MIKNPILLFGSLALMSCLAAIIGFLFGQALGKSKMIDGIRDHFRDRPLYMVTYLGDNLDNFKKTFSEILEIIARGG